MHAQRDFSSPGRDRIIIWKHFKEGGEGVKPEYSVEPGKKKS